MKKIETIVVINAPIEQVWATLINFENHPHWNPFIKHISGDLRVGSKLTVEISQHAKSNFRFTPVLKEVNPPFELRWDGKLLIKGLFDGEHFFILEKVNDGVTNFIHGEIFSGLLIPFTGKMIDETKFGFEKMNNALKAACEN